MVFLGFLAFNVLQGGKHSNVTKVTHTAEETTITSAESSVSGESTSNGESTKASENSSADKVRQIMRVHKVVKVLKPSPAKSLKVLMKKRMRTASLPSSVWER